MAKENITYEELNDVQRAIWKAQTALNAAINNLENPVESTVDQVELHEIIADYLKKADSIITPYI